MRNHLCDVAGWPDPRPRVCNTQLLYVALGCIALLLCAGVNGLTSEAPQTDRRMLFGTGIRQSAAWHIPCARPIATFSEQSL